MEQPVSQSIRACAHASTGGDASDSFQTNTHAPERAPEEREWKRGERCKTPEERAAKKAYFYARKLALQRARRASNPRIDYKPSVGSYGLIKALVCRGLSHSAAIDRLLSKVDLRDAQKTNLRTKG
jgi:hypothetical protein